MSMLPFLKKKNDGGGITTQVKLRKPDMQEPEGEEDSDAPLMACAQDLMDAVHAQDAKGVAQAFRAAFDILESQPHEEFEHDEMSEENE